ncbi:UNKNOWN [Stylonychia lemnae]|uniref:Uncharacterized protein n=1 Tax=Stylonychia lemnae TaxID=5949 RepID=A0A078APN1_STYLE|nr:UNKNOWN [Stylonychia lemnae]|eukprot:CDW84335.1 UNKNOWN [Stylonychia lemnae]
MRKFAVTLMISAFVAIGSAAELWEKSGTNYESLTAAEKQAQLWEQVTSNPKSNDWFPAYELGGLFVEGMSSTLKWVGDTFENGWLGVRSKYIHTVGNTAQVKYTPVSNSEGYTGIFASGADHGLIRLSAAKQFDKTKSTAAEAYDNFTPGFGLKFLRDGVPSGNLVAMYGVNGFDSWNFFKMDFSNHIPDAQGLALTLVAKKFATATPFVQYVGLSDIATYDQHGKKTDSPKFPFQLVFEPTLKNKFSDDFTEDFQDQLASIPANTLLYKVYSLATPSSSKVHIGDLTIKSQLVRSYFGDRYLFFKHQDIQEDLVFKPEWKSDLKVHSSRCPFSMVKEAAKELAKTVLKL